MILQQICFDARRRVYFAQTDAGLFQVPPTLGGWAQRSAAAQATCTQGVADPQALAQFLGMLGGPTARVGQTGRALGGAGGCGCKAAR